jgi:hypothetical protein
MTAVSTYEPWAAVDQLGDLPAGVDDDLAAEALQVASDVLFQFTRRKYPGVGLSTIRPAGRDRSCPPVPEIRLPSVPVVEIVEVVVDGVVVDPTEYRVDNDGRLVRLPDIAGRPGRWPAWQDLTLPATEVGTFEVTYRHGQSPPSGGVRAAVTLARELAAGWSTDPAVMSTCRLPKRVTTISRQGVTLAVLDPLTLFADGLCGIPSVDLWVASDRYGTVHRSAAVFDTAGVSSPRWQDRRRVPRRSRRETPPPSS